MGPILKSHKHHIIIKLKQRFHNEFSLAFRSGVKETPVCYFF